MAAQRELPFGLPPPRDNSFEAAVTLLPASGFSHFAKSSDTSRIDQTTILLPKASLDEKPPCCVAQCLQGHLDHAKDYHDFCLHSVAWAIQNKIEAAAIERYLNSFDALKIKTELRMTFKGRSWMDMFPILFFAVEQNSPDIVRVLCKYGADPSMRVHTRGGLPLLAYTILSAEYNLSDTTDTLLALLAVGASPDEVPEDMWQAPLQTPKMDFSKSTDNYKFGAYSWYTPGIRKALAKNMSLLQRYSLWRAKHLTPVTPRLTQIAKAFSFLPLLETPYHIIGQLPAIKQVIDTVASHYLLESSSPLVLLFTGPSGHGKTEVAKRMGALLSVDLHLTDCTEMRLETDLFGPKAPYQGHQKGTGLNNFLAEHSGERAVVFLDEFEKSTEKVFQAMLLPFESGTYIDRRNGTKLDCTKIIWILAANLGEEVIRDFWSSYSKTPQPEPNQRLELDALSSKLEKVAISTLGAPLTGRLSCIVPFLPFNALEQAVTAYKFMRELKNDIRKPVDVNAKLFPRRLVLDFKEDGKLAQHVAQRGYVDELGARSLQKAVHQHIKQKLAHLFLLETTEIHDGMNVEPMAAYEAKLVATGADSYEVALERAGTKDVWKKEEEEL